MNFDKPKILYKYSPLSTAELIIRSNSIKFSDPSTFNDPFDCDVNLLEFKLPDKLDEHTSYEIETIKLIFQNHPGFNELIQEEGFIEKMYKEAQIEKVKGARVSCFSLINNNILMWLHYADKHKGICLEFDSDLTSHGFTNLAEEDVTEGEVGYAEYEKINYLSSNRIFAVYKMLLCKSNTWSYEKEFRLITLNRKPELQKFKKSFLKSIYFGLNVTSSDIETFISLCSDYKYETLKFFKAEKRNLTIEFEQI
ncbi:DUF2971 domain-containing protein [Kaistella sp. G5-32]|uniref:DUF2971 domain-containing protein n=1 Tax=Kaistella gelatinilytica TaxID=2787636 RepID=A0ABS0FBZ6_9FLAO|nr:DUF2971 domain-containing protein [Kaistella gelatinilytica]MBF8457170.1 DUF2971 domain-containing protein [Kaistella gelatinilytica]